MLPTLVMLPGMDGTGRLFDRLLLALRSEFPVVVLAYPTNQCLSAAELQAMVQAAIPPDVSYILIAESFSGAVAIEHAATHPENLRAVVLSTSFVANPLPRMLRWLGAFVVLARKRLPKFLVKPLLVGMRAAPDLVDEVRAAVHAVAPKVIVHRLRQVMRRDVRGQLLAVAVPVMYLAASQDRLVGLRGLAQCERCVPRLASEVLAGPHLLLQRRPSESAAAIRRFVRRVLD